MAATTLLANTANSTVRPKFRNLPTIAQEKKMDFFNSPSLAALRFQFPTLV